MLTNAFSKSVFSSKFSVCSKHSWAESGSLIELRVGFVAEEEATLVAPAPVATLVVVIELGALVALVAVVALMDVVELTAVVTVTLVETVDTSMFEQISLTI